MNPKRFTPHESVSNKLTYVLITDQVTLINEDPKKYGVSKLTLIDLEAYVMQEAA